MANALAIVGTDTDVGKTVFAAGLCAALGADYWKPVQAGLGGETDTETAARLGNLPAARLHPEAWRLKLPASPHIAAKAEGLHIAPATLALPRTANLLVVETAGGLLVPINDETLFIDIVRGWRVPAILCARTRLGTINHSLLSLEALAARAIPVAGIAFIGEADGEAEDTICRMGAARHLGRLPPLAPLTAATLAAAFAQHIDLDAIRATLHHD